MHTIAAASSAAQSGFWAYLVVFALMVLSFAGIPAIGAAVVGWLAVFFISTIVCGMLKMRRRQFAVWNFVDAAVYVLAVGPAAYGAGKAASGEHDWGSLGPPVAGLAIGAGCGVLAARYLRNHRGRGSPVGPAASPPHG